VPVLPPSSNVVAGNGLSQSGNTISANPDGSTLDTGGAGNSLEIKSAGVGTTQLAAGAVTPAKQAQAPTLTMPGNNTGGTANLANLTVSQIVTMLGLVIGTNTQAYSAVLTTLASLLTTLGDLIVEGSSGPVRLPIGSTGQVLTVVGGTAAWAAAGGGGGITYTNVTGTSQAMAVNTGYIANNAALVTLTLPATAAIGSVIPVVGNGAGGWKIAQNAGQNIMFGVADTTTGTGGSLASTNEDDCVELVCTVANTTFVVRNSVGNVAVT
jgi:hypothetical protein